MNEFLNELHQKMLAAQQRGGGFDLTFDEIAKAWGYQSKSAVTKYIPELERLGLVTSKISGAKTTYRAVERRVLQR